MLNWYIAVSLPLVAGVDISEIYVGATTEETPMPNPPMKRKNENIYGFGAIAVPIADTAKKMPTQNNVFFLPYLSAGMPPINAPTTVPHKAIDMIKMP